MLIIILFALLGLCFGSWFNVVVFRGMETERTHCKGQRSECPKCGHKLGALDLIPVFSWLFLGGECRYCKEKISWVYPVGEALTAICFTLIGVEVAGFWESYNGIWDLRYIPSIIQMAIGLVAIIVLSISTISDLREKTVFVMPIYLGIATIIVLRLVQMFFEKELMGMMFSPRLWVGKLVLFIGIIIVFTVLSRLLSNKIGGGDFDILLLLYCAGWVNCVFNSLFIASIVGCIVALIMKAIKKLDRQTAIPMVPLLYVGYLAQMYITFLEIPF